MTGNENSGKGKKNRLAGAALIAVLSLTTLLVLELAGSLSFTASPIISPQGPDTTHNILCSWNASGDATEQNITWYQNGVPYRTDVNVTNSQSLLDASATARGEIWNCSVSITNGTETTVQQTNTTIINAPPTIPSMTNSTGGAVGNTTIVIEDVQNNFTILSTDPDGDAVTYDKIGSLPTGASLNSNTGELIWTPQQYVNTDVNITLYSTDSYGEHPGITTKKVLFQMQWVNDAPEFSPLLTNKIVYEGQVFNYLVGATDEEDNLPINITAYCSNLSLEVINTSNTTGMIMLLTNRTATYTEAGNYTVMINATDSLGAVTEGMILLEIRQTNIPPELVLIPNHTGTQGQRMDFAVHANDYDANDTLQFNITTIECPYGNIWSINTTNSSRNGTSTVNVTTLNNSHVVCNHIRIIVIDDAEAEDSQDVFLNISNTNDPPIVQVLSFFYNNTGGQSNLSSLTAFAEVQFTYMVNATDPDTLTYEGEVLEYSDNSSLFTINSTTGLVVFTPSQSDIGNHSITITVMDDELLSDSEIMNLEIINNSAPILTPTGDVWCPEDLLCFVPLSATDQDSDDELNFTSNHTAIFSVTNNLSQSPRRSAYANYTPTQAMIGNYSVRITVTDSKGAADSEIITVRINNTNDAPALNAFSFPKIVETHSVIMNIYATDEDYSLAGSYENLTFYDLNLSGKDLFNIDVRTNPNNNQSYGRIIFTPEIGDAGNYSVRICVNDSFGEIDCEDKNFTVLAKSNPPNITMIRPHGLPYSETTVFSFTNTSNYASPQTAINFSEDLSVLFNISVDDETPENLSYSWSYDGTIVSPNRSYNKNFDYFSSGSHNVSVTVEDDMFENSSWTWVINVINSNRAPLLMNNLLNITVNRTETFTNYFKNSGVTHFLDPDDDLDSNSQFDAGENSSLTYSISNVYTNCTVAQLTISSHSLSVRPLEMGVCTVSFVASDLWNLTVTSNGVRINITSVPNETEEVQVPTPSTGGGGGGRSSAVVIPMRKEELKPQAIELVVPEVITVYENRTVLIPVTIQNTWNSSLKQISLSANTTNQEVSFEFTTSYFEELAKGEKRNVSLLVRNYRMGEDYKISITANVTDPKTSDTALVFLNTIEQSEAGKDVETKVTFAQDLLNDNPECLELNELLMNAKTELQTGSRETAAKLVDGVIEGCKYLVSISKKEEQRPDTIIQRIVNKDNLKYLIGFGVLAGMITAVMLGAKRHKKEAAKKEAEEAKKKEEAPKPYWP